MKKTGYTHICFFTLLLFSSIYSLHAQWSPVAIPGNESTNKVINVNNIWLCQTESGIYRSENDGLSWKLSRNLNSSYDATIYAEGNDLYLIGTSFGLLKSADTGVSWQTQSAGPLPQYPSNMAKDLPKTCKIW